MSRPLAVAVVCLSLFLVAVGPMSAQNVPNVIRFNGLATDEAQAPITGVAGATFAIYKDARGGAALWIETQNIRPDAQGHYAVLLGAATKGGLPPELFSSGEARWLGVRFNGGQEEARVLLVSVPYAMKAADADTLGGLPASAFLTATSSPAGGGKAGGQLPPMQTFGPSTYAITGTVSANYLPKFTDTLGTETNSRIFDNGTRVGINTATPGATVDVWATLPELRFTSTDVTQSGQMSFYDNGALGGFFQYRNGSNPTSPKLFRLGGWAAGSQFGILTAGVERVRVDAAGNMGIGTSTPAYKLDVVGNVHASGAFSGNGSGLTNLALSGTYPNAVTFSNASNVISGDGTGLTNVLHGVSTAAGSGLTSSVSAGVATLSLPTCTAGQLLKWNTTWGCANDISTSSSGGGPVSFSGSNTTTIVSATQTGVGIANPSPANLPPSAVLGRSTNATGFTAGVTGISDSNPGGGILGIATSSTTNVNADAPSGVIGIASAATGRARGVSGEATSVDAVAGHFHNDTSGTVLQASYANTEVLTVGSSGFSIGVSGQNGQILGNTTLTGTLNVSSNLSTSGTMSVTGNLNVGGTLTKGSGSFKIDHPLDPENKFLYHSFVESPDMMNIYNGVATLDARGQAWIQMPDWFEALNMDFRYQLTALGGPEPNLYIAREIKGNRFRIAGGRAHGKVSWQVTGIRHDAYANAHRIPVEEAKPAGERGTYLHPELFPQPEGGAGSADATSAAGAGKQKP